MLFLVALFWVKNGLFLKNRELSEVGNQDTGLVYNNIAIADLINKDTDEDGILDWEEGLWGTDPTKKETTQGTPDSVTVNKLRAAESGGVDIKDKNGPEEENLTETDKFSRELFSTVAATTQNGAMNEETAEKISSAIAEHIKNSPPRKIYMVTDFKLTKSDLFKDTKDYADALGEIFKKYQANYSILDVLQKFIIDENNVDASALLEFNPLIDQTNRLIDGMVKVSVPPSFLSYHVDVVNALERVVENISDIKLYEDDVIVALGGISKYEANADLLEIAVKNLTDALSQKLNN
ncbi:MAG TPA: hypothetical protein VJH06_02200 [Candidatus Paceibacterota bacterium]